MRTTDVGHITLRPGVVLRTLLTVILTLATAHGLLDLLLAQTGRGGRVLRVFNLGAESNIPTFYSGLALLSAGLLGALIARVVRQAKPREFYPWAVLACGFTYLAVDEVGMLHEMTIGPALGGLLGIEASGFTAWVWVVPGLIASLGVAVAFLPFLFRLPPEIRRWAIASGLCYIAGCIGCEMVGAKLYSGGGENSLAYHLEVLTEETLEMTGVALWIYTQLLYLTTHLRPGPLTLHFDPAMGNGALPKPESTVK